MTSPRELDDSQRASLLEAIGGLPPEGISEQYAGMGETALAGQLELAMERIAELEFARDDAEWSDLSGESSIELSRDTLRTIIRRSQVMYLKNPLIDHGCSVISHYVFGQGVEVAGTETTNDRISDFMATRGNRRNLFGKRSRIKVDAQLSYEGNVFLALFGEVGQPTEVRVIPTLQIVDGDIITNPDDDSDPWLYKRRWTQRAFDRKTGRVTPRQRVDYYPALGYRPRNRPSSIGAGEDAGEVHWDTPVLHVADGGLNGGRFGIPTTFSSLDWAKAVVRDLNDYATVRHALARFAWRVMAKSRTSATRAKTLMATTVTPDAPQETNPPPGTGSAWIGTEGNELSPIKTAGAQPSPEEGRRVGLMVSAGLGIPETILFGNADVGNLATAKTLDRPTELMMTTRQETWNETYRELIAYDLTRAIRDRAVPRREPDPAGDGNRPTDTTDVRIDFPPVLERSTVERVAAIVEAATLGTGQQAGTMPADVLSRLLLVALEVEDVDDIIEELFPDDIEDDDQPSDEPTEGTVRAALDAFTAELARGNSAASRPRGRRRSKPKGAAEAT